MRASMTRFGEIPARRGARVLAVAGLVLFVTAACAPSASAGFDRSLQERISTHADGLNIPADIPGVGEWDALLVLCPYADLERVPAEFQERAAKLAVSSDGTNHLLFSRAGTIRVVSVPRDEYDFCAEGDTQYRVYDPEQLWRFREADGGFIATPLS